MEIISKRQRVTRTRYSIDFQCTNDPNRGYSFHCDSQGTLLNRFDQLITPEDNPERYKRLEECRQGFIDGQEVEYEGFFTHVDNYVQPAVGRCDCGVEIELANFTNTCGKCGADYNASGDRLASREQWGEETGEHWTECY